MSSAEDVLCMSVKLDPDYAPMLSRISSAIDAWKHWCGLLATRISDWLKLFLSRNWYIVTEWIIINNPQKKWIYVAWDWVERVVTYDSYSEVEKENEPDYSNLPF